MSVRTYSMGVILILLAFGPAVVGCAVEPAVPSEPSQPPVSRPPLNGPYTYEVVNAYPHDPDAFTQGLVYRDGVLYEGTGKEGSSSLRRVRLETGEVIDSVALDDNLFGEGIALCDERIVQLTWRSHVGFVYDRDSLERVGTFTYETEGWGLTCDGTRLIMSDGTSRLHFLDPETFDVQGYVAVHDGATEVRNLNELEYINGQVYANVWPTDRIAVIDPSDGRVTAWLDLSGLLETQQPTGRVDVLNGIAYDAENDRLFVTGKWWPWLFEIDLMPE
jgi:glutaminyl-peptide cyclotransferase